MVLQMKPEKKAFALIVVLTVTCLLFSCATAPKQSDGTFRLDGKTRYQEKPLSAGKVMALRAEPGGTKYTTGIEPDGSFAVDLPPGPYLLMGWSSDPLTGEDLFAYWTNNPFRLLGDVKDPVVLPFVRSTGPDPGRKRSRL